MKKRDWHRVFPAMTTPFAEDLSVDYAALERLVDRLIVSGCKEVVALGSLGEAPALTKDEKIEILKRTKKALKDRAPLIAGISGVSTPECVALAKAADSAGTDGLMILPPFVYRGDWMAEEDRHVI